MKLLMGNKTALPAKRGKKKLLFMLLTKAGRKQIALYKYSKKENYSSSDNCVSTEKPFLGSNDLQCPGKKNK